MISTEWFNGFDDLSDVNSVRNAVFRGDEPRLKTFTNENDIASMHLVLYDNHRPVAAGSILLSDFSFVLYGISVIGDSRGDHIGDFLVRLMIRKCFDCGAKTQYAFVPHDACGFFEKLAFKPAQAGETIENISVKCGGDSCMIRHGDINE